MINLEQKYKYYQFQETETMFGFDRPSSNGKARSFTNEAKRPCKSALTTSKLVLEIDYDVKRIFYL